MKFWHKDEHDMLYFLDWDNGYLQPINEWRQFAQPGIFNWITFTLFRLDFDLHKIWWRHFDIVFMLLGVGFRFHISLATEEQRKQADLEAQEFFDEFDKET